MNISICADHNTFTHPTLQNLRLQASYEYYKHPFRLLIPKISTGAYYPDSTVLQEHHQGMSSIQPPPFSPSRLKQEQYNTDVNYGTGNVDRADTTSPFYNNLAQYPNGGQSYGIDEPDTRFSTSPNSVPSSQFQKRLSGQSSTLPHASMGSGPDSVVSEKHFPGSPPGTLRGQDPTLSFSTPVVSHDTQCTKPSLQAAPKAEFNFFCVWAGSEAKPLL